MGKGTMRDLRIAPRICTPAERTDALPVEEFIETGMYIVGSSIFYHPVREKVQPASPSSVLLAFASTQFAASGEVTSEVTSLISLVHHA